MHSSCSTTSATHWSNHPANAHHTSPNNRPTIHPRGWSGLLLCSSWLDVPSFSGCCSSSAEGWWGREWRRKCKVELMIWSVSIFNSTRRERGERRERELTLWFVCHIKLIIISLNILNHIHMSICLCIYIYICLYM